MHTKLLTGCALLTVLLAGSANAQLSEIGFQAELDDRSSVGISGTVTVLSENQLLLEDFTYDGRGGGQVELRLAPQQTRESFFFDGVIIALLRGPDRTPAGDVAPFLGDQNFTINLPTEVSAFDFGAISVWCDPFRLDFGSGTFLPPEPMVMASADFDNDGDVDGGDFLALQRGFGITSGASPANGDANNDLAVNADDLTIFNSQFGTFANASSLASSFDTLSVTSVPEPSSLLLISLASTLTLLRRRSR